MATLEVEGQDVVVRMSALEQLGAFRGDVDVPLASVRDVRASDDAWSELRGIRSPGTGWPGVIALGTRKGRFGKDFAAVYRHRPAVVVDLDGAEFSRLVVTADDAPERAQRIADAARRVEG